MLNDFISLIYPRNCAGCGESLLKHEEEICNFCYLELPKTNFHLQPSNPLKNIFYGRVDLETVSAFYLFQKKGSVQKILHAIKYKDKKELATLIGKWYAEDIAADAAVMQSACIIPVPLHPLKYKQRGYNQSEEFAKGLAEGLSIPLNTTGLRRKEFTTTQTRKARFERWENVEDKFEVDPHHELKGKYVTLVDDVITTGATVEACCLALKEIEGIKINVLSIAYASS
jgi:ComF family protein